MAFGNGEDHGVFHSAGVKLRRTHEVSDVLQDGKIHILDAEVPQPLPRHAGVQMAHAAGVELDDLDAGILDRSSIHVRIDVRLHHADTEIFLQRLDRAAQRCGLAGTGRAHEIEQKGMRSFKL